MRAASVLLFSWLCPLASWAVGVEIIVGRDQTESDIRTEVRSLRQMVVEQQVELRNMQARLKQAELQAGEQELGLLQTKNRLEKTGLLIKDNAKVAFYAALTDSEIVGPHSSPTVLKFSKVFTNVGKAYSATTGLFTAPVKGVYVFRFTICGYMKEGVTMGVRLIHNEKSIVYNLQTWSHERYGFEHLQYLSNAVILELNVGDEIHLVLPENETVYDNYNSHSTFSGFLLFSM
ncbi:complement C1q-like protein 4 [Hippoglossus stenolepis]|uniref:complement C1q-like protein 4 n=1 Tax=Hippoglossus stenolepis TaxID=195615 RepID=UPI001FAFB970|nr:complement C1q-like protein 4 [Hippoglossus stenolepis]